MEQRTQKAIVEGLRVGRFITHPGDTITIKISRGVLSDSITLQLTNDHEGDGVTFSISNKRESWEWLKKFNDMGGRAVFVQTDNDEPVKFKNSLSYRARFADGENPAKYAPHELKAKRAARINPHFELN